MLNPADMYPLMDVVARLLQGPDLKWHKEYAALNQQAGRVLMIDFARSGISFPPFYTVQLSCETRV